VVESKGTMELNLGLRGKESSKIKCGKAHFNALDSEMVVAARAEDIENYALSK